MKKQFLFAVHTFLKTNSRSLKAQLVIDSSYAIFLALHLDGAFAPDLTIFRVRDQPYQKPGDNNPSTSHAKGQIPRIRYVKYPTSQWWAKKISYTLTQQAKTVRSGESLQGYQLYQYNGRKAEITREKEAERRRNDHQQIVVRGQG